MAGWVLKEWAREVTDFLKEIGKAGEARVLRELRRMSADGHNYRGNTRPLGARIFELKVSHGRMAYRLLYVYHAGTVAFLVCFEKKKQKTPKKWLDLAKERHALLLRQEVTLGNVKLH